MNKKIIPEKELQMKKKVELFKYEIHKVANVLAEYDTTTLKASIKEHGLFQPVLLWYDKVARKWYLVDGKHRVKAWYELYDTDIPTHRLDRKTTLGDLPKVILEAQIIGRGLDVICANCEATLYLQTSKGTATELAETYDILNAKTMSALKTILEVRPVWFSTLRNGDFVEPVKGEGTTKSIQKLADICRAERDRSKPRINKDTGDESIAVAFSKMKPQVDAILSLVGKDEKRLYVLNQLIKQGTKDFSDDYCLTVPEIQIQELEQEVETISKSNDSLMEHIENTEQELDDFKVMYAEYRLSKNVDDTDCDIDCENEGN